MQANKQVTASHRHGALKPRLYVCLKAREANVGLVSNFDLQGPGSG
jgi:hypothetical protein